MKRSSRKHKKQKKDETFLPGSTVKMNFRKHFLPPFVGFFVMLLVFGLFNSQYIAASISKATFNPMEFDTPANSPVEQGSRIIINSIGVKAPVIFNLKTVDEGAFQLALRDGVVHYPNTAMPGEPGNVAIFGHSSGQVWAPGKYKFVFTHLEKLEVGKKVFLEYKGTRYIYDVTDKKIVQPTDISVLNPTSENTLTLITCTPVGTSKNRLIITAKQIVPKPTQKGSQSTTPSAEIERLPSSNSPSFWDSIQEWF